LFGLKNIPLPHSTPFKGGLRACAHPGLRALTRDTWVGIEAGDVLKILIGLGILFLSQLAWGQPRQLGLPPIHNYTKQDYQAETQNWAATEDSRGLLYFGNNLGLLEFDGTRWRCYSLPNRSIVRSIATDSLGRILVGAQDEMGYFEADEQGTLRYHSIVSLLPDQYQDFEDIWEIFITPEGTFWASQKAIFLQKSLEFEVVSTENRFDGLFYCRDQLYLAEFGKGLQLRQAGIFRLLPGGDFFANIEIKGILSHATGGILIFTIDNGIFHYQNGQINLWLPEIQDYLVENRIYCALELNNGNFALGTSHQGLLILDSQGNPVRNLSMANGLLNNSVLSLHEDRSQNLWIGLDNGISHVELGSPFSWINAVMGVEGTAHDSRVHEGKLYLATNQGIYHQNWSNPPTPLFPGRFELVANTRGPNWSLNVLDGELIAGQHYGAVRIDGTTARRISPHPGAWKHLQLKNNPRYAVEGTYSGLLLYEKPPGQNNWVFKTRLEGFSESSRVMAEDQNGDLWVSHPYRGVFRVKLDPVQGRIREVKMYTSKEGFPSDLSINVTKIQEKLLFTTEKGVYVYDETADQMIPHEGLNRFLGEETPINRLIEDQTGTIWFSTESEFGILNIEDQMVEKQVEKLPFNRLLNRLVKGFEHIYAYDEQHTFIGTDEGFILYNPQQNQNPNPQLPLYIREVVVTNGRDSLIFGGTFFEEGRLAMQQPESKVFSFPPSMHDFRMVFSAAFYEEINEIRYQYFLEGQDANWSEWTNKTEKEYTNLGPGEYAFQVKARNTYGLESETAVYRFTILPHWYQTLWARLLFLVLGVGLFVGIFRFNAIRLRKSTEALQHRQKQTLQQKEAEYQQEAQKTEAEIIRLRNEKLEAEVRHKNKELASSTMHLVQKGEILLKIKQNLEKLSSDATPVLKKQVRQIIRMIDDDIRLDQNWKQFEHHFDQVHEQFLHHLREKYPSLTPKDQRLCAYLRMNLTTKEIAQLMNISVRGVEISRYRLRKKLELPREVNLNEFMTSL
jgi:ligand-binding sensor domain-containing protein/DNA-binding CsgD family transcriptional regulator/cell division protein FtsB